jgi:hypothetical protein
MIIKGSLSIFFILQLTACINPDVLEEQYDNYSEVLADGAIARGWIPEWLPEKATNIYELHNLDTNYSMLRFTYPIGAKLDTPNCEHITAASVPNPRYSRSWWPRNLSNSSEVAMQHTFLHCGKYYIAFSSGKGEAYVWQ